MSEIRRTNQDNGTQRTRDTPNPQGNRESPTGGRERPARWRSLLFYEEARDIWHKASESVSRNVTGPLKRMITGPGSGLYGEGDPGPRESMNPDQNRNSEESSDPSDHPQATHYPGPYENARFNPGRLFSSRLELPEARPLSYLDMHKKIDGMDESEARPIYARWINEQFPDGNKSSEKLRHISGMNRYFRNLSLENMHQSIFGKDKSEARKIYMNWINKQFPNSDSESASLGYNENSLIITPTGIRIESVQSLDEKTEKLMYIVGMNKHFRDLSFENMHQNIFGKDESEAQLIFANWIDEQFPDDDKSPEKQLERAFPHGVPLPYIAGGFSKAELKKSTYREKMRKYFTPGPPIETKEQLNDLLGRSSKDPNYFYNALDLTAYERILLYNALDAMNETIQELGLNSTHAYQDRRSSIIADVMSGQRSNKVFPEERQFDEYKDISETFYTKWQAKNGENIS